MAVAGFCSQCGENVFLDAQWGCSRGHPWSAISGWYDTETGVAIAPPWAQPATPQQVAAAAQPESPSAPVAPPIPAPEPQIAPPPDPAVTLRRLIRTRLEELNLTVSEQDGVYSASRGEEYECVVGVDGHNGRVVLWERLRAGRDPGVREAVRTLAGANWTVRVVLKRDGVTG